MIQTPCIAHICKYVGVYCPHLRVRVGVPFSPFWVRAKGLTSPRTGGTPTPRSQTENITFPHTTFAGGKMLSNKCSIVLHCLWCLTSSWGSMHSTQVLHSIHCHGYVLMMGIISSISSAHDGWPINQSMPVSSFWRHFLFYSLKSKSETPMDNSISPNYFQMVWNPVVLEFTGCARHFSKPYLNSDSYSFLFIAGHHQIFDISVLS